MALLFLSGCSSGSFEEGYYRSLLGNGSKLKAKNPSTFLHLLENILIFCTWKNPPYAITHKKTTDRIIAISVYGVKRSASKVQYDSLKNGPDSDSAISTYLRETDCCDKRFIVSKIRF